MSVNVASAYALVEAPYKLYQGGTITQVLCTVYM